MSAQDILAELPKLKPEEREIILSTLVELNEEFAPSPTMEHAIREGLRSFEEERTYSETEIRSRIAAWTAR